MNDIEKIGAFVQQLRKDQNLTQKELAMRLGIKQVRWSVLEIK